VTSTAGTTSALTISVRFGPDSAGTVYMNARDDDTQQFGGGFICMLTATEIAA
jgi:hypothetical protein